jgi:hypothetical protein
VLTRYVWNGINFHHADELIDVSGGFGSDDDGGTDGVDDITMPVEASLEQNSSTNTQLKVRKSPGLRAVKLGRMVPLFPWDTLSPRSSLCTEDERSDVIQPLNYTASYVIRQ